MSSNGTHAASPLIHLSVLTGRPLRDSDGERLGQIVTIASRPLLGICPSGSATLGGEQIATKEP